jgi:hypothetical protein
MIIVKSREEIELMKSVDRIKTLEWLFWNKDTTYTLTN